MEAMDTDQTNPAPGTVAASAAATATIPQPMVVGDVGGGGCGVGGGGGEAATKVEGSADTGALFDVEAYISKYVGQTRQKRLRFIAIKAEQLQHDATRLEAYKLLITTLKQGIDIAAYKEACGKVGDALGPDYTLDSAWVAKVEKSNKLALDRMEQDLQVQLCATASATVAASEQLPIQFCPPTCT